MPKVKNGVDESSYQDGIDNAKIAGDFILVKATQGTGYINPAMNSQLKTAQKAGKKIGLYHFANAGNYAAEANYFLRIAKPYLKNAVLALDYEGSAVPVGGVTWAKNFLDYVYKETGTKPLIYMSLSDENSYNWRSISNKYYLWVAQYNSMAVHPGYKPRPIYGRLNSWNNSRLAIVQYTPAGRLSGWPGDLDLDYYNGQDIDWNNHAKNETKGDIEMTWHPLVMTTYMGAVCVTKKSGATLWAEPNNDKKLIMVPYGKTVIMQAENDKGFYKITYKGKTGWIDWRTVIAKKIHCSLIQTCMLFVRSLGLQLATLYLLDLRRVENSRKAIATKCCAWKRIIY
ncbi:GH25 family lysozyme [Lactobacillus sp. ESL0701]|uniref:GH25 family lysozyme n=1 Tax=Lactobacillus sp. ESL0701 TaxID=2983217 RepID=UPI0023F94B52|nr:GH25 family lysozyme [Lactobacillus sp. ESL0701]MDF7672182.1 GH25 family lysozyme [Lactobacillus sp. ESL0701]